MRVSVNITNDEEFQRRLIRARTEERNAIGQIIRDATEYVYAAVASKAPTARVREGIGRYGWGYEGGPPMGRGIPKKLTLEVARVLQENQHGIATILTNNYYLGRFWDTGFSGSVQVKYHARKGRKTKGGAARKGWGMSYKDNKARRALREQYGKRYGQWRENAAAMGIGKHKIEHLIYGRGRIPVEAHKRKHRVPWRPWFDGTIDSVHSRIGPMIDRKVQAKITELMGRNG